MKVSELIQELEQCDQDKEVYHIIVGGDWRKIQEVNKDIDYDALSIVPYEEENFVGLK